MHAGKLSLCARMVVSLARWGRGLTVLLEKICGNNYVHKLWAICLFEADFNRWHKLVFTRRMIHLVANKAVIPEENFTKKGSDCNKAVMTKRLFTDISMVLHHPARLGGYDFSDCYDRGRIHRLVWHYQDWVSPKRPCAQCS